MTRSLAEVTSKAMRDRAFHPFGSVSPATVVIVVASGLLVGAEQPGWWNSPESFAARSAQTINHQQGADNLADSWMFCPSTVPRHCTRRNRRHVRTPVDAGDLPGRQREAELGYHERDGARDHQAQSEQFPYSAEANYPATPPPPGAEWEKMDRGEEAARRLDARRGSQSGPRGRGRSRLPREELMGKRRRRGEAEAGGGDSGDDAGFGEDGGLEDKDLVREYSRSFKGRLALSGSSSVVGAALAAMISQSTIRRTPTMSLLGLILGLVLSVAKGSFGDLFRAMGLALLLALRRSQRLSADYPVLPYLRRALVMAPRRPFPPAENPWAYRPEDVLTMAGGDGEEDNRLPPDFSMAKSLLAASFLGGFVGYVVSQFVFLPTFVLALTCGGLSGYAATMRSARGDLARLLGMRTVAFLGLMSEINSDVQLPRKAGIVGGICVSKAMFWDRKYRIRDRAVDILSSLYASLASAVREMQRNAGGEGRGNDELDGGDMIVEDVTGFDGGDQPREGESTFLRPNQGRSQGRVPQRRQYGLNEDSQVPDSSRGQPPPPQPPQSNWFGDGRP